MTDTNGNTSGQTTGTTGQTTGTTGEGSDAARAADFQSQLARYNDDALRMAERLHERNYQLRQRAQSAEAQIPEEGMVVLSEADAELLEAYKGIGTPDEISEQGNALSKLQKYQMVSEAAAVAQMNPRVLSRLLPKEAVLEIGEATGEDGQAKQVVSIVEGEDKSPLLTYAESNWSDFLPALSAEQETQVTGGTPWIQQQGSTASDGGDGTNPLLKKKLEEARNRAAPRSSN